MLITFYNTKGGTGKTSLATLYSYLHHHSIITNDVLNYVYQNSEQLNVKIHKLDADKKSINPAIFKANKNLICDLSSSMSILDNKVPALLKKTDILVIPTLTDMNSLEATRTTLKLVKNYVTNIHIVINRTENEKDYLFARKYLQDFNIPIHAIKKTRLFHRLAQDGTELFDNIFHTNGEWQLKQTLKEIDIVFDEITSSCKNKVI